MIILSADLRSFLMEGNHTGKIATVRADGRPHIAPVWYGIDGDTLVFLVGEKSVKAINLRQNNRIAFCIDDERPPFSFATIEGTVTLSDDLNEIKHWATTLGGRYMGQDNAAEYGERNGVPGQLVVHITPTHIVFHRDIAS